MHAAAAERPATSRISILTTRASSMLAACALLAGAPPASAADQPIEYYTRRGEVDRVAISPKGNMLAAALDSRDRSRVTIFRLPDLKALATTDAGDGLRIGQLEWVSGDRLACTLHAIEPERLLHPPTAGIFTLRARAAGSIEVESFRFGEDKHYVSVDILGPSAAGGERLLISEHAWQRSGDAYRDDADAQPDVAILDIRAGKRSLIERLPLGDADVLFDEQGRVRFATGYDTTGRHAVMWKQEAAWTQFRVPGFRVDSLIPRHYSEFEHALTLTGAPERESLIGLYRYDVASGVVTKLYAHPEVDVASAVFDLSGEKVIGARVEAARPEYYWIDGAGRAPKIYDLLERAFPQQDVRITSSAAGANLATAFVQSDTDPGAYYLVDVAKRNADLLFPSHPWVDPAQSRPMESVSLQGPDGIPLHGYLIRPRDGAGPFPLVVLVHAHPYESRDVWGYDWETQLLANHGYAVLRVNYRGSAGYGEDFRTAGRREWGGKMQDDLTDATRWAIDQGIATKDNVCIYGTGYGGYAALMGAVREPGLYRCAASYGGITDLQLLFDRDAASRSAAAIAATMEAIGTNAPKLRTTSPAYNAGRIEAHMLLMHDKNDPVVSYAHATHMNQALLAAGKTVRFETLDYGVHELYTQAQRDEVWTKLLGFLYDELRGGRLPIAR